MNSELYNIAQQHIPGGVNSPVRAFKSVGIDPLFVERADGKYLYGADGVQYLDFCLSWGAVVLGHNAPVVRSALLDAVAGGTSFGFCHKKEALLAGKIKSHFPSIDKIRFVNSGTEAVISAVRLARAFTKRSLIVKFDGCYHGHGDSFLVAAGSGVGELVSASSQGVPHDTLKDTVSIAYNDFAAVENIFASRGSEVAALIIEPVAGNMGLVPPVDGYLQFLRDITTRYGALLIFDEVITGFRVCCGGVQTIESITPDLTTLGKIIGGGLPVGAFGGRAEIMEMLAPLGPVYQAGTLSGNPLAMSAGIAVIDELSDNPQYYAHMEQLTKHLAEKLIGRDGISVNRYHTLFSIFFTGENVRNFEDVKKQDMERFRLTYHTLFADGILLPPSAFETGFVSPLHAAEDIERLANYF